MKAEDKVALFNLLNTPRLGPQRVRILVSHFKEPQSVFKLSTAELCSVEGIDLKLAASIRNYHQFDFGEQELERAEALGVQILTFWDTDFPTLMKKMYDPPVLLYVKGQPLKSKEDCLAVVGTRSVTIYGKKATSRIVTELVTSGIVIVSGLARGVDSIAHRSTLKQEGRTIAVLGNGIDTTYPRENERLAEEICADGTVITEFPLGTKPDAVNFPQRNRIISGLSHGTLVVEAGTHSGAILTALNAIDQNREVFAVPGRITDKLSVGCNRLIRNGAIPIQSGDDILQSIQNRFFNPIEPKQQAITLNLTDKERLLVELLGEQPLHIDEIVKSADMEVTKALALLLTLELKGVVMQLTGKHFVRV
ncbi:MAG: DNA-processing protein DprA [Fidelibacterota bacterium]